MLTTIRGVYERGHVFLKEKAPVDNKTEVMITFLTEEEAVKDLKKEDTVLTHFASQHALSKDWLTPEEDEAWKNL